MKTVFVVSIGTALFGAFDDIDAAKRYLENATGATSHQQWQRLPTHDLRRMLELHHGGKIKGLVSEVPHATASTLVGGAQ
jgi:hypothetical protein